MCIHTILCSKTNQVGFLMRILARLGVGRERVVREGHYYDRWKSRLRHFFKDMKIIVMEGHYYDKNLLKIIPKF